MVKIRCISETDEAGKVYDELKKTTELPLSTALAIAAKEFLKKKGLVWKGYAGGYGKEGKGSPVIYKNVDGQFILADYGKTDAANREIPLFAKISQKLRKWQMDPKS